MLEFSLDGAAIRFSGHRDRPFVSEGEQVVVVGEYAANGTFQVLILRNESRGGKLAMESGRLPFRLVTVILGIAGVLTLGSAVSTFAIGKLFGGVVCFAVAVVVWRLGVKWRWAEELMAGR